MTYVITQAIFKDLKGELDMIQREGKCQLHRLIRKCQNLRQSRGSNGI